VKGEKESHECGFWLWWEYGFIKRGYRDEGLGFVQKEPLNSYGMITFYVQVVGKGLGLCQIWSSSICLYVADSVLVEYIFEKLAG
ncbi:hypothetical protein Tco_1233239, partial [Tanacetum coccineum]